jgi:hypothetical protein
MRALLLHDGSPDAAFDVLAASGHEVVTCAPGGTSSFACAGIDGTCPLDARVDVAVAVCEGDADGLAAGELGVICALRDGVPLVVAGSGTRPYAGRAAAVAATLDDLPASMAAAVEATMAALSRRVSDVAGADVELCRDGDAVRITVPDGAPERTAVLAHQAAHRLLPGVRSIDVVRR